MDASPVHSRRRRVLGAVAILGSVGALAAGCSRGGMPWRTTTTRWQPPVTTPSTTSTSRSTTPSTDCHGHTNDDHRNLTTTTMGHDHGGGGDDHHAPGVTFPPCNGQTTTTRPGQTTTTMGHGEHGTIGGGGIPTNLSQAQIDKAIKLVNDTKAAVTRIGYTATNLTSHGFVTINDAMTGTEHFVHPARHYDGKEFDPNAIEAFAIRTVNGRRTIIAAMYVMENGKTMANIPNIAGSWTMFHDHRLPFASSNPRDPGFYQLRFMGGFYRQTAPMLHVWLIDNPCGPFAGTDTTNMTGSCEEHGGH
jgi:hypothetical protein